jgi:hypothetical protein
MGVYLASKSLTRRFFPKPPHESSRVTLPELATAAPLCPTAKPKPETDSNSGYQSVALTSSVGLLVKVSVFVVKSVRCLKVISAAKKILISGDVK